jgi:hypothetical protein
MVERGSLACEIIPAGNLLFSFIMKFFSSVERNSRYAASFDASLAHLSVRLIVGLGSPSASCSKFHLTLKLEPHTQPNAL